MRAFTLEADGIQLKAKQIDIASATIEITGLPALTLRLVEGCHERVDLIDVFAVLVFLLTQVFGLGCTLTIPRHHLPVACARRWSFIRASPGPEPLITHPDFGRIYSMDATLEPIGRAALPEIVHQALSNDTLARLLDQSLDCIKLISPDGKLRYMNRNGRCSMEVDSAAAVLNRDWVDLWPPEAKPLLRDALVRAAAGEDVRFEAFCPTAKGSPRWWDVSVSEVLDDHGSRIGYLSVSRDVTDARRAREVAEIASAEMRHRLKNSYAMVAGLLSSLARGLPEREEFAGEVRQRLSALAEAQTLFVARDNAPCDLNELLPALLNPFEHPGCTINIADVAGLHVEQAQADALALVLGELAVNSSKHGALSERGVIDVSAARCGEHYELIWDERSSREVAHHERNGGQGLRLMNRILSARDGAITISWHEAGLTATVRLPLS